MPSRHSPDRLQRNRLARPPDSGQALGDDPVAVRLTALVCVLARQAARQMFAARGHDQADAPSPHAAKMERRDG